MLTYQGFTCADQAQQHTAVRCKDVRKTWRTILNTNNQDISTMTWIVCASSRMSPSDQNWGFLSHESDNFCFQSQAGPHGGPQRTSHCKHPSRAPWGMRKLLIRFDISFGLMCLKNDLIRVMFQFVDDCGVDVPIESGRPSRSTRTVFWSPLSVGELNNGLGDPARLLRSSMLPSSALPIMDVVEDPVRRSNSCWRVAPDTTDGLWSCLSIFGPKVYIEASKALVPTAVAASVVKKLERARMLRSSLVQCVA
jgi:hypothetical protein